MTHFKMNLTPTGYGSKIELDGEDISEKTKGISLNCAAGSITEVYLQMMPGVIELEGEGIVHVLSSDSIKKFLEGIDPIVVREKALESLDWNEGDPIIAAVNIIKSLGDEFDGD